MTERQHSQSSMSKEQRARNIELYERVTELRRQLSETIKSEIVPPKENAVEKEKREPAVAG
tara:strand:- start:191 stop:373 length:183 start_codon:yes stop_codon:yes gene_type:complete